MSDIVVPFLSLDELVSSFNTFGSQSASIDKTADGCHLQALQAAVHNVHNYVSSLEEKMDANQKKN